MSVAIFKNPQYDIYLILAPILIALLLPLSLQPETPTFLWALVAVSLIDSGHVYITMWRTWLNPHLKPMPPLFIITPILVFVTIAIWQYFNFKWLWSFVVYFTVYHNIRQLFGINKWYQLIYESKARLTDYLLYAVCTLSFIAFHFRNNINFNYYASEELFIFPNQLIFNLLKVVIGFILLVTLAYEAYQFKNHNKFESNRVVFLFGALSIYIFSFLYSSNELELMAPLVLTHGLHYLALTVYAVGHTQTPFRHKLKWAACIISLFLLLAGFVEYYFENNFLNTNGHSWINSIIIGLYLVPLLTHFIFDAIIWRKKYSEFSQLIDLTKGNKIQTHQQS